MSKKHDPTDTMRELWDALLRFRWRFVVTAFLVATAVLCVSLALPRKYKAEAIFERRTDMVLTEITRKGAAHTFQDPRGSLTNELAGQTAIDELLVELEPELRRRGLLTRQFGLHDLRHQLLRRVVVQWDVSSNALDRVRVSYIGNDAELAQLVVNGLVEQYITRTRTIMEQRLNQSAAFFRTEVARNRSVIGDLENALIAFEIQNSELLPENPNNVQAQLSLVQAELAELLATHEAAATRVEALRQSLGQVPVKQPSLVTGRNPRLTELQQKRRDLQAQLELSLGQRRMTPQHPDVILLRQQIAQVEEELGATDTEIVLEKQMIENPRHAELKLLLTTASAEHRATGEQIAERRRQIEQMSHSTAGMFATRSQFQKMSREVQEAHRQLAFWEDNLRRVEMAMAADSGNHAVRLDFIKPATTVDRPVSPDLSQVLAAALGLGLFTGGLGVFLAHRSDEAFHSGADLADAYGLPLLGSVGELITQRQRRLRQLRQLVLYPANVAAMAAVLGTIGGTLYLDLEHPDTLARFRAAAGQLITTASASEDLSPGNPSARPMDERSASVASVTD